MVHEPIDLTRITQRMRMDEYRDIESLTTDIDLIVNNTKKYYQVSDLSMLVKGLVTSQVATGDLKGDT